jgi:hypothetical protein
MSLDTGGGCCCYCCCCCGGGGGGGDVGGGDDNNGDAGVGYEGQLTSLTDNIVPYLTTADTE